MNRGILFMLTGVLLFTSVNMVVKDVTPIYPMAMVVFFRFFFALFPTYIGVAQERTVFKDYTWQDLKPVVVAGVVLAGALPCLFMTFKLLPFADATALSFTSPLATAALAFLLLKEQVSWEQVAMMAVGFGGVVIMAQPSGHALHWGVLWALIFAFADAYCWVSVKKHASRMAMPHIVFLMNGVAAVITGICTVFFWETPTWLDLSFLILLGFGGGVGQLCVSYAYKYAPAAQVAPLNYTAMVWSLLAGWFIWHEAPSVSMLLGASLIVLSGLYLSLAPNRHATKYIIE